MLELHEEEKMCVCKNGPIYYPREREREREREGENERE